MDDRTHAVFDLHDELTRLRAMTTSWTNVKEWVSATARMVAAGMTTDDMRRAADMHTAGKVAKPVKLTAPDYGEPIRIDWHKGNDAGIPMRDDDGSLPMTVYTRPEITKEYTLIPMVGDRVIMYGPRSRSFDVFERKDHGAWGTPKIVNAYYDDHPEGHWWYPVLNDMWLLTYRGKDVYALVVMTDSPGTYRGYRLASGEVIDSLSAGITAGEKLGVNLWTT